MALVPLAAPVGVAHARLRPQSAVIWQVAPAFGRAAQVPQTWFWPIAQ